MPDANYPGLSLDKAVAAEAAARAAAQKRAALQNKIAGIKAQIEQIKQACQAGAMTKQGTLYPGCSAAEYGIAGDYSMQDFGVLLALAGLAMEASELLAPEGQELIEGEASSETALGAELAQAEQGLGSLAETPLGKELAADVEQEAELAKPALGSASEAAFKAADDPASIFVKDKHLSSFNGRFSMFATADKSQARSWIAEGLRSDRAVFKSNGLADTFKVEVDMQKVVGTRGQTGIRIIVANDGRVINAFPFKVG
jgi:hypothetical protein